MELIDLHDEHESTCNENEFKPAFEFMEVLERGIQSGYVYTTIYYFSDLPEVINLRGLSRDFNNNRMTDAYFSLTLWKNLSKLSFLRELDLSNNHLTDSTALLIAVYLKTNKVMTVLNLKNNDIEGPGANAIFKALEINEALNVLIMRCILKMKIL